MGNCWLITAISLVLVWESLLQQYVQAFLSTKVLEDEGW